MSSKQFSSQIRQLEEEGVKLLAATNSLGKSLHLENSTNVFSTQVKSNVSEISAPEISALADISEEQKTIANLGRNLDEQCQETERFHREMFNTSLPAFRSPKMTSTLNNLEIPITSNHSAIASSVPSSPYKSHHQTSYNREFDTSSTAHTLMQSQQLRQAQNELSEQRGRLKEAISISEQQKSHFRETIEELRGQLHTALADKDALLQKSKRDLGEKDLLIAKLQETLNQFERTNKLQDGALMEMKEQLSAYQKDQYITESVTSQMKNILQEREIKRRKPFFDNEPIKKQSLNVLVHTLEKCLHELDMDVLKKQEKLDECLLQSDDMKVSYESKLDGINMDHKIKVAKLQEEHDREIIKLTDQYRNFKEESSLLQEKLNKTENKMSKQLKVREDEANNLESRFHSLRKEYDYERKAWSEKKAALEQALDDSQKEAALSKGEKDAQIRLNAQMESRLCDLQTLFDRLNQELTEEREKSRQIQENNITAKAVEERLHLQMKHKDQVLHELEQKVKVVKQDADAQIATAISSMEKEGRAYIEKEIITLKTQNEALNDKNHKMHLELEVTKADNKNLEERLRESKTTAEKYLLQINEVNARKESLAANLSGKDNDIERVTQEKDYYFKLIEERNQEISTLKAIKEKLSIQLEEREKNFHAMQQQNDKMSEFMNDSSKSRSEILVHKEQLQQQFNEKVIETEDLRKTKDLLVKKIRIKEKKIQDLESENARLSTDVGVSKSQLGSFEREKQKLSVEVRKAKSEIANMEEEKASLIKKVSNKEKDTTRELERLKLRLKSTEHEFRLASKTLKTMEEVDGKAVKVAGKMQKEVTEKRGQIDTLQTRIHWLEECLDASVKDKAVVQEENEKLTATIFKLKRKIDQKSQELQNNITKNTSLREKILTMEGDLEKASKKIGMSQAELELQQQEIARLQLKHQLQLKEISRTNEVMKLHNSAEQAKPFKREQLLKSSYEVSGHGLSKPLTATNTLEEKPVRDIPKEMEGSEDMGTNELRHLLSEMRTLITSQQKYSQKNKGFTSNDSTVYSDSELQPVSLKPQRVRKKTSKNRNSKKYSVKQGSLIPPYVYNDDIVSDSVLSPASLTHEENFPFYVKNSGTRTEKKSADLAVDSQDVCKRLEKKIQNLSKIGNRLQKENKEIAKVMQDQDEKLKKVRSQITS